MEPADMKEKFRRVSFLFLPIVGLLVALSTGAIVPAVVEAGPQLLVAPTRVVIEGRTRTASVNLVNRGDKTGTFRLTFERKRMTETGRIVAIEQSKPGEIFADQMIRYAPRQVTLSPGQSQVIRLMVRKPANLPDGEYRSHLLFQGIPQDSGKSIQSQSAGKSNTLNVEIIPVLGVSIPVIVRQGKTQATVTLENLQLENRSKDGTKASLVFRAKRSGSQSIYGDFTVFFTPDKGGKKVVVSRINGLAIYTPNVERIVSLQLKGPDNVKLDSGTIEVVYNEPESAGQKELARATARIAPLSR